MIVVIQAHCLVDLDCVIRETATQATTTTTPDRKRTGRVGVGAKRTGQKKELPSVHWFTQINTGGESVALSIG